MPAIFPKRAEDGSFRICAVFAASPDLDTHALQNWLDQWAQSSKTWETFGEIHRFNDYFSGAPQVTVSDELAILFVGVPQAPPFWKDWFVRLMRSATERFPDLGELQRVENA